MAASEKNVYFFLIKIFHHLLKTYFASGFGKVLFYLLCTTTDYWLLVS